MSIECGHRALEKLFSSLRWVFFHLLALGSDRIRVGYLSQRQGRNHRVHILAILSFLSLSLLEFGCVCEETPPTSTPSTCLSLFANSIPVSCFFTYASKPRSLIGDGLSGMTKRKYSTEYSTLMKNPGTFDYDHTLSYSILALHHLRNLR